MKINWGSKIWIENFRLCCITFLIIIQSPCYGQNLLADHKSRQVNFLSGYIQQKELNLMPKVHSGFQYVLEYQVDSEMKYLRRFRARFGVSPLTTPWETSGFSANLEIQASYFQFIQILNTQNWKVWTGPFGRLTYNTSFYPNWDESHLYWANQMQTGLASRSVYKLQGQTRSLFWDFNLPVLGLLSRPNIERNYKINDFSFGGIVQVMHYQPQIIGLINNFQVHSRIGFIFPITQKKQAQVGYHLDHMQVFTKYSNQFIQSSHQMFFGINL
ncbi:hypothetical protein MM239_18150 [Belliella sp. DSM 111904]|uniref:DUF2490 domain-containing protein n=1 Tax=Belliella filtrata TaxID=2923435 RepID=A0ABS9V5U2_9BACT|nr:hypothetical protein [Belliella filtrata]MCH7411323.1 hypothetical protein [Belliella filtrata]